MITCPNCKISNIEDNKFCIKCGQNLMPSSFAENRKGVNKKRMLIFVILIIITVLAIVFVYLKLNTDLFSKEVSSEPQAVETSIVQEEIDHTQSNSSLRFPEASDRILSRSELAGYSSWDLRIMRNEIFAKYGYIFKSEDLRNYFSQQSWYKPRYSDVSGRLTSTERQNAATIKSME